MKTTLVALILLSSRLPIAQAAPVSNGANDFISLTNIQSKQMNVQIRYVGDHVAYVQDDPQHPPRRLPLSELTETSRAITEKWKQSYGKSVPANQLHPLVDAATKASVEQPLFVDPDPSKKWKLNRDFSDEFNQRKVDDNKWERDLAPWGDRAWRAENVSQKSGALFIEAKYDRHTDRKGREFFYTLGILQSKQKTTYGYFEARIKGCSRFPGLCPAFWLYSHGKDVNPDYPNVTYSEIDIVEMLQGGYDMELKRTTGPAHIDCNLHTREIIDGVETWRRPQQWPEVCRNSYNAPWDPSEDFHVYACENTPERITWFIDGIQVATSPNHNWHLPMTLTLTMELRPPLIAWAGVDGRAPVPENSTPDGFPTHMEVDYVRSWTQIK